MDRFNAMLRYTLVVAQIRTIIALQRNVGKSEVKKAC